MSQEPEQKRVQCLDTHVHVTEAGLEWLLLSTLVVLSVSKSCLQKVFPPVLRCTNVLVTEPDLHFSEVAFYNGDVLMCFLCMLVFNFVAGSVVLWMEAVYCGTVCEANNTVSFDFKKNYRLVFTKNHNTVLFHVESVQW